MSADEPDSEQIQFFETRVRPVLVEHCGQCHSGTRTKAKGELRLDSREGILVGGRTGPAVVAGNEEESLLIDAIGYENDELRMPPEGKLPDSVIADFIAWVRMGVPYPPNRIAAGFHGAGIDFEKAREFWAFQNRRTPGVPQVDSRDRVRTPVDAFILAKLESAQLTFSPDADRFTLLRRAYLDLTRLLPMPGDIETFLAAHYRSPARFTSFWRALGTALAGCGRIHSRTGVSVALPGLRHPLVQCRQAVRPFSHRTVCGR